MNQLIDEKEMFMKSMFVLGALILFFLFSAGQIYALDEILMEIESRPGIKQKFILIKPENPIAGVILFEGAHGGLNLYSTFGKPGIKWGDKGFLARTREFFAEQGLMVSLIDSPEDKKKMDAIWRMSSEHAIDVKAVANALKQEANVPVWVIGMSMGTFSAANSAIRINPEISGLILVSSVTRSPQKWEIYSSHPRGILNMDYREMSKPTLIVAHKEDGCDLTPTNDAPEIKEAIKNSNLVEITYFTGGKKPKTKPCFALSQHGFYGIEERVASKIVAFIKNDTKQGFSVIFKNYRSQLF
jgi:dienelactone hydrolase